MLLSSWANSADVYKIKPGDVLAIEVYDEPDLTGDFKVSSEGTLALNWLEPIEVKELNVEEIRDKLLALLKTKYIKNPIIKNMALKEGPQESSTSDKGITVLGAVKNIGVYKYKEGSTVMNAIIDAGGFSKFASKNRVVLQRGKGKNKKTYRLRMGDVMEKGQDKKDIPLAPGDVIIVKEGFL